MRHDIPEEPSRRERTRVPLLCLDGPTDNMDITNPRTKSSRLRNPRKAGSISSTCKLPWPVRGDMKRDLSTKPVWGRTAPVCSVQLSGRASCPAVASRRAICDGDCRDPTPLDAKPHDTEMAVGPKEKGKLAHGRKQPASLCAPRRTG